MLPQLKCTCPDFTGIQLANPSGASVSRQIERTWSASQITRNGKCKHIYAVLLELESKGTIEKQIAPVDYPTPQTPKYKPKDFIITSNKNSKLGDSFL